MEIEFGVTKLPKFDVPDGYTSWEYLNKLCYEGLDERYPGTGDRNLKDRVWNMNLSVIQKMGYVDYFLIVWDFIHFAREHDIMVGPGQRHLQREVWFPILWGLQSWIRSVTICCLSVS